MTDDSEYKGIDVKNIEAIKTFCHFGITEGIFTNKTTNKCMVCLGENNKWDSYIIPCGHTVHTWCFRKYMTVTNKCVCPVCNTLVFSDDCVVCSKKNHVFLCSDDCCDEFVKTELKN